VRCRSPVILLCGGCLSPGILLSAVSCGDLWISLTRGRAFPSSLLDFLHFLLVVPFALVLLIDNVLLSHLLLVGPFPSQTLNLISPLQFSTSLPHPLHLAVQRLVIDPSPCLFPKCPLSILVKVH